MLNISSNVNALLRLFYKYLVSKLLRIIEFNSQLSKTSNKK